MNAPNVKVKTCDELKTHPRLKNSSQNDRAAFILEAGLDVLDLDYSGSTRTFIPLLVEQAAYYGSVKPGVPAVVQLLRFASKGVGIDRRAQYERLIDEWNRSIEERKSDLDDGQNSQTDCAPAGSQSHDSEAPRKQLRVFYSYAREDERFREKLQNHLSILRRQGFISEWTDRNISAGAEWRNRIDVNLEAADIVLLLVTDDFLASDYCYDVEMQRALERHETGQARVIPIILRPVQWKSAPFGKLQALPRDGKPCITWTHIDEAFADVAQGIHRVIDEIVSKRI